MYDKDLINYYLKVPIEDRKFYKLFHPFMLKLCGGCAEIPYQRTNLPASVPVDFWDKSQKIQSNIEELYRQIAHNTNGKKVLFTIMAIIQMWMNG